MLAAESFFWQVVMNVVFIVAIQVCLSCLKGLHREWHKEKKENP